MIAPTWPHNQDFGVLRARGKLGVSFFTTEYGSSFLSCLLAN